MRPVERILVATDFSLASQAALDFALALASQLSAQVMALHVAESPPYDGQQPFEDPAERRAKLQTTLERKLQALLSSPRTRGAEVQRMVRFGLPWEEIKLTAEEYAVDLIVMGTHGRRGLSHVLIASVTQAVIQASHLPVLVVHAA